MTSIPQVPSYEDVLPVVYKGLDELNQQRARNQRLQATPECVLFGESGNLNSLELSNFIVLIEQLVQEKFDVEIDLTDGDPFSPESGHMRTAGTLAAHISNLVREQA
jgi:acyl carrier protein